MEKEEKFGGPHLFLLALTLAFLCVLGYFAYRDRAGGAADTYTISVERGAPAEELMPEEKKPIDINAATAAELEELMGIGPVLAQAIVDYRAEHGPFASVEELLEVSGIGEAKLDRIRNDVTIGDDAVEAAAFDTETGEGDEG